MELITTLNLQSGSWNAVDEQSIISQKLGVLQSAILALTSCIDALEKKITPVMANNVDVKQTVSLTFDAGSICELGKTLHDRAQDVNDLVVWVQAMTKEVQL